MTVADATGSTERIGTAHVPTMRNADLGDLMMMLRTQQAHKVDLVVPAEQMRFSNGQLVITGQEVILGEDGVVDPNGEYWPTQTFDDGVAERLDITTSYLRRLRHGKFSAGKQTQPPRLDLWDSNVNGLMRGRKPLLRRPAFDRDAEPTVIREGVPADSRSFFLRLLRPSDGPGIARAMLSNKFARLDNIDGLLTMLDGIREAGVSAGDLTISGDLSETRMMVHVAAPQILAAAPTLLDGYRSPFDNGVEGAKRQTKGLSIEERIELGRQFRERGHGDGNHHGFYEPGQEPLVHAGFLLTNSEVGNGRWQIMPEITVLRCSNGLTMTKDGFARTHVGSRLDDGHVAWSEDTNSKELMLVRAQTRDVVKAVLSTDYLERTIQTLEAKAGAPVVEPKKTIELVAKKLAFSKEDAEGILSHFLMGGQLTSGGIMQAVTSYSQTLADPDAAYDLNSRATEALELAFSSN